MGDLDTIVLAALRPEAERRYDSASRLVEDVERFLAGQPILARKDSLGYRARKFVGRNRFIVAASAAALAALVGLSAFYTARLARERDVAEREAAKARQVSEFLAGLFHGPDPYSRQQSGELTALQLLDEGTQHLETELGDQPEVKASLLHTLAEVYRRLGRHEPAEKLIDQAVELRRVALGPDHPDTLESLQRQGVILRGLDQLDRAIPIVRQVAAGWERLYGPNDERLAMALADLALMLERNHQIPEARPLIERAIGIFERAQPVNYDRLSQAHWVLGEIFANGGDSAAGIRETRIAIQLLREKVDPDHPRLGGLLSDLAYDLDGLGHLEQAHAVYADALATVEKRLGPGNSHTDWIRMNAARVELALGEPARALAMIDQSPVTDRLSIRRYALQNARAQQLSQTIQQLMDAQRQGPNASELPQAHLVADPRTNALLVTASESQHSEIKRLLETADASAEEPGMKLAITFIAILGPGSVVATLAIAVIYLPILARVMRTSTLVVTRNDYVAGSRARGASHWRVMLQHVAPNALGPVIVQASVLCAFALQLEAGLSFLGLGVQPPTPSLGGMLADGRDVLNQAPWVEIFPGLAIVVMVLAFSFLGEGLRRACDPQGVSG